MKGGISQDVSEIDLKNIFLSVHFKATALISIAEEYRVALLLTKLTSRP